MRLNNSDNRIKGTLTLTDEDVKKAINLWLSNTSWGKGFEAYCYIQDVNNNKCKIYYRITEAAHG